MAQCYNCGTKVEDPRAIFRSSECPQCGKDMHVCLNCRFYDPAAHWQCRETISEEVREKDRANFCDYFVFRDGKTGTPKSDGARRAFDSLFGDG